MCYKAGRSVSRALRLFMCCVITTAWLTPINAAEAKSSSRCNPDHLKTHVDKLAGLTPPRNHRNRESLNAAAEYIRGILAKYAPHVEFVEFEVDGGVYKNVIAWFGAEKGKRIIFGAHYDVCGVQPGADDNGSGVAALLEMARLLSEKPPILDRRIELAFYALEEPPYFRTDNMGSFIHARNLAQEQAPVEWMLSLDMIGWFQVSEKPLEMVREHIKQEEAPPGFTSCLVGRKDDESMLKDLSAKISQGSPIRVIAVSMPLDVPGVDYSDHLNFWKMGYTAMMLTNFFVSPNPHYHEVEDTTEGIDFTKLAHLTDRLTELAGVSVIRH